MVTVLPETTKNPITLIGHRAGVCTGADVSNAIKDYWRGLECLDIPHGRALEFVEIHLLIEGYSARVIREWYTHIGGAPTRLQQSTRYTDAAHFKYVVPPTIGGDEYRYAVYDECMEHIRRTYDSLTKNGVPKEDAAMLLPLGMETKIVDKRNLRNLIDMAKQRKCNRAYWEFRKLFREIENALYEYSDEWRTVVDNYLMPKCEELGRCPEAHGCGKYGG